MANLAPEKLKQYRLELIKSGISDEKVVSFLVENQLTIKEIDELQVYKQDKIKMFCRDHIIESTNFDSLIKNYIEEGYIDETEMIYLFSKLIIEKRTNFEKVQELQLFHPNLLKDLAKRLIQIAENRELQIIKFYNLQLLSYDEIRSIPSIDEDFICDVLKIKIQPITGTVVWDKGRTSRPPTNKTNIFILGLVGSGKSVFLAGLMYNIHKTGNLVLHNETNPDGSQYVISLLKLIKKGKLPPRTADDFIQYIEADLKDSNGSIIPFNFYDMSGEIFQGAYGKTLKDMPKNLIDDLEHENNKIFFLALDCKSHYDRTYDDMDQDFTFENILTSLAEGGTLNHTKAICLLITKWDESGLLNADSQVQDDEAVRLLKNNYANLLNLCKIYSEKFGFSIVTFTYSLGNFRNNGTIEVYPSFSQKIYEWLCTMPRIEESKKGFLDRISKILFG